jgi:hypothetical protein
MDCVLGELKSVGASLFDVHTEQTMEKCEDEGSAKGKSHRGFCVAQSN